MFKDLGLVNGNSLNSTYIQYTWEHKLAFLLTEKKLLGFNKLRGFLHDADKLVLYMLYSKAEAHKIHTSTALHHIKNAKTEEDYLEMIIDMECARETKHDKPLNAYETMLYYFPELLEIEIVNILLDRYGLRKVITPGFDIINPKAYIFPDSCDFSIVPRTANVISLEDEMKGTIAKNIVQLLKFVA